MHMRTCLQQFKTTKLSYNESFKNNDQNILMIPDARKLQWATVVIGCFSIFPTKKS